MRAIQLVSQDSPPSNENAGSHLAESALSRVICVAHATRGVRMLDKPIRFGEREYTIGIRLKVESLAARGAGVELVSLLDRLESFPNRRTWPAYLRRALVPLTPRDGDVIAIALKPVVRAYDEAVATYRS